VSFRRLTNSSREMVLSETLAGRLFQIVGAQLENPRREKSERKFRMSGSIRRFLLVGLSEVSGRLIKMYCAVKVWWL